MTSTFALLLLLYPNGKMGTTEHLYLLWDCTGLLPANPPHDTSIKFEAVAGICSVHLGWKTDGQTGVAGFKIL